MTVRDFRGRALSGQAARVSCWAQYGTASTHRPLRARSCGTGDCAGGPDLQKACGLSSSPTHGREHRVARALVLHAFYAVAGARAGPGEAEVVDAARGAWVAQTRRARQQWQSRPPLRCRVAPHLWPRLPGRRRRRHERRAGSCAAAPPREACGELRSEGELRHEWRCHTEGSELFWGLSTPETSVC